MTPDNIVELTTASDDELWLKYRQNGDQQALSELLITRHYQGLYSYLYYTCGNRAEALDCLQDAHIKLIEKAERYHRPGNFRAFLFTMARNICLDNKRRARFERTIDTTSPGAGDFWQTIACLRPQPDQQVISDNLGQHIMAAVDRLPPLQREVFLLKHFGELTFQQIADQLKIPLGTALGRMRRAILILRKELADVQSRV